MKTLCLNMIVKNEAHIIKETLENLVAHLDLDYWVISDTGSTDQTQRIILEFFQEKNIPGELFQDTWKDFGHNRTLALEHAYQKSDYLFIFDADDKIMGNMKFNKDTLTHDQYSIKFGKDITYVRTLLIDNHKRWKFVGVLHEYITSIDPIQKGVKLEGDYYVDSRRLGFRSNDADKYKKDAIILSNAYHVETDQGLKDRYAFYAAQSYKDSGQTDQAIEWYTRVLSLANWVQEKYISCIRLGDLYHRQNKFEETIFYYTKSMEYDPERIEGIVTLCRIFYEKKLHTMVNVLYEKYKHHSLESMNLSTKLFLCASSYDDEISYYNSISSYYLKNQASGYESCKRNLLNRRTSISRQINALDNLIFYQDELKKDTDTYTLFVCVNQMVQQKDKDITDSNITIWNLLFEKNRSRFTDRIVHKDLNPSFKNGPKPRVFLSFTTCKRVDLFCQTVNSILHCWEDLSLVDYWFCVDDHSSNEDRKKMKILYPWMEFVMKDKDKGHLSSMNIIYQKLESLRPTYWIHLEDDFLFFDKMNYVTEGIRGLTKHSMKQVLFNRSYGETIDSYRICSHRVLDHEFSIHEYNPQQECNQPNCYYWPHYSFRPSIMDVSAILTLGKYEDAPFFERAYADRWTERGYTSGFFNKLTHLHIGRLTKDQFDPTISNAYSLNGVNQFENPKIPSPASKIKVVHLKHREDRKQQMIQQFMKHGFNIDEYEFVEAVDAYSIEPTIEMYKLFKKNDFGNRKGFIGCALSHYRLWKELLTHEDDSFLIMEDDCTFTPNIRERIILDRENDIVFLGYHMFSKKREEVKQLYDSDLKIVTYPLDKNLYIGGTFAYTIHKRGAQKLCDYIETHGIQHGIDYVMKIVPGLECNETRPQLVFSPWCERGTQVDSDIQTNHDSFDFSTFTKRIDDSFVFVKGKDQHGKDIRHSNQSLECLKLECFEDPNCIGFNTLGFMKHSLDRLEPSKYFKKTDGIYLKKEIYHSWLKNHPQKIRVKLLCNWCSSEVLVKEWSNLFQRNYGWNEMDFTWEDHADYFVIINKPLNEKDYYVPEKTIVFQMEPWVYNPNPWGVKTWGKWACPDENLFLKVFGRMQDEYNNVFWQLEKTYTELKNSVYPDKKDTISCICSNKYFDEGHIHRIDFLRFMETKGDVPLDVYGNEPHFKNYRSVLSPYQDKSKGFIPYKYYFMVENNYERNFITEKLWEPILCESLCFYFGCPNVKDLVDERAFVLLDMYDFESSYQTIKRAISEDWWSQRIEFIRQEKQRILEMSFCPRIEKVILQDIKE